jgi:hypothetical protein
MTHQTQNIQDSPELSQNKSQRVMNGRESQYFSSLGSPLLKTHNKQEMNDCTSKTIDNLGSVERSLSKNSQRKVIKSNKVSMLDIQDQHLAESKISSEISIMRNLQSVNNTPPEKKGDIAQMEQIKLKIPRLNLKDILKERVGQKTVRDAATDSFLSNELASWSKHSP